MSRACQKQPLNDGAHPYTTFGMASQQALDSWDSLKFAKQQRFIKMIVAHASITEASQHLLRLDITLNPPLHATMTGYLYRQRGSREAWSDEEKSVLKRLYTHADRRDILQALPGRVWDNIKTMAEDMGLHRATYLNTSGFDNRLTYSDYVLLQELNRFTLEANTVQSKTDTVWWTIQGASIVGPYAQAVLDEALLDNDNDTSLSRSAQNHKTAGCLS